MRNDNDRNPKDFYGKTEAELRKLKQTKGISQRDRERIEKRLYSSPRRNSMALPSSISG